MKQGRVTLMAVWIVWALCLGAAAFAADDVISPRLQSRLVGLDDAATVKVWVYFTDKDQSPDMYQKAVVSMTARAADRRKNIPLDWYDLPVRTEYIEAVKAAGGSDVRVSRWLNAVSARLTRSAIEKLTAEKFINKVDLVLQFHRDKDLSPYGLEKPQVVDSADYGQSFIQNHQLGIDLLHRTYIITDTLAGDSALLDGSGVLVAFLDTGYDTAHVAFDSMSIINTRDFINDDDDVTDFLPISEQVNHGTTVLSVCGAFDQGELIGPAYGADYILAKTERVDSEIVIEEDHWVQGSEWADSLGADIISSSLGYIDWYTYADLDGNTAITTIAADIAASRGILIVTAAGNEGDDPWHYIIAPSDGDSVMAIGAVNATGAIAAFSSFGPSYDGRIKPEVVAMGVGTRGANAGGGYGPNWGTSLSTPLIAGSAALVLQANPSLRGRPYDLRQRIISAGDQYLDPDFQYGYGLPDMVLAAGIGVKIYPIPAIIVIVGRQSDPVIVHAAGPTETPVTFTPLDFPPNVTLMPLSGDSAEIVVLGDAAQEGSRLYQLEAAAGIYADTLVFTVVTNTAAEPFMIGPNPFRDSVVLYPTRSYAGGYVIEVFTLAGEIIYRENGFDDANIVWDGTNQNNEKAAAGVYIIRFSADGIDKRVKVLKL